MTHGNLGDHFFRFSTADGGHLVLFFLDFGRGAVL
jgi:hypothetical protein